MRLRDLDSRIEKRRRDTIQVTGTRIGFSKISPAANLDVRSREFALVTGMMSVQNTAVHDSLCVCPPNATETRWAITCNSRFALDHTPSTF